MQGNDLNSLKQGAVLKKGVWIAYPLAQDPPAYILAAVTINDADTYRQYQAGFGAILRSHRGVIVGINREPTILEGEWSANLTVLLRFASREQALEWYNSEDY